MTPSDDSPDLTNHIAEAIDWWRLKKNPDVTVNEILSSLEIIRHKLTEGVLDGCKL